jgi:GH15 family glucan-1,4-alpha-glucosidase
MSVRVVDIDLDASSPFERRVTVHSRGTAPGSVALVVDGPARLEDYALLGDCRTAALVSREGSIDWWCVPRFDSGACFAALLGTPDHGRFLITPVGTAQSSRRYLADSMVLETEHDTPTGRVRVTDCLATDGDRPLIVRMVEGVSGEVAMRAELVVRFDYGSIVPWVRTIDGVWRAIGGPDGLELRTPAAIRGEELKTVAEFTVGRRDRVPFVLNWFPSHDPGRVPRSGPALIARTTKHWRNWSARCSYTGRWRDPVLRSMLTLESLTFAPTGGIVAAPTTSLPETLGGSRNWDYRFCWVRDATLTLEALIAGGYREEAARWREWLLRAAAGEPEHLQTMYGVGGERRLTELELDWLPGYSSARPVRTGNAAHEQLQLDVYGELADVLWQGVRAEMMLSDQTWGLLSLLLESLETRWTEPDDGIWEVRGPRRHFTHSKVMCWVAFDRGIAIAEHLGFEGPIERWRAIRDQIHDEVCSRAYNTEVAAFVQSYDSPALDAAVLMIPLVGFLPADDPRVVSTIAAIRRDVSAGGLSSDGFVMRYVPTETAVDGIGEREGVFLPCSFWLVEALALAGETADALALFERLLAVGNDVGLYAEEYDPDVPRLLGNFPQAFTHLALVAAAHTLEPEAFAMRHRRRDRTHGPARSGA